MMLISTVTDINMSNGTEVKWYTQSENYYMCEVETDNVFKKQSKPDQNDLYNNLKPYNFVF